MSRGSRSICQTSMFRNKPCEWTNVSMLIHVAYYFTKWQLYVCSTEHKVWITAILENPWWTHVGPEARAEPLHDIRTLTNGAESSTKQRATIQTARTAAWSVFLTHSKKTLWRFNTGQLSAVNCQFSHTHVRFYWQSHSYRSIFQYSASAGWPSLKEISPLTIYRP